MPVPPAAPAGPRPRKDKPLSPADIALAEAMVIHRDASALVLDKPPGLATQGGTKTDAHVDGLRSEEHTSELQSLMRISYAVFRLQKKNNKYKYKTTWRPTAI